MAYFCYFSFGENLDFPDFLQKSFITSTPGWEMSLHFSQGYFFLGTIFKVFEKMSFLKVDGKNISAGVIFILYYDKLSFCSTTGNPTVVS